jgi:CBS-domain-containing membrane protein
MKHRLTAQLLALSLGLFAMTETTLAQPASGALSSTAVEEVLNQSLTQKKGMAIYIGGQLINAIFVKRIDANSIEVKNQTHPRIIIRMDRVDAIAIS